MANENKPVKKFQAGGVSAALWKHNTKFGDGKEVETLSVTLDRRYMDKDGNWKSSASLRLNDIPKAVLVLSKAYDYMVSKGEDNDETPVEEAIM